MMWQDMDTGYAYDLYALLRINLCYSFSTLPGFLITSKHPVKNAPFIPLKTRMKLV